MTRVGVIGAGLIGGSICKSLRNQEGFDIVVFSPSETTLADVRRDGFSTVSTIVDVVAKSDVLFVCVPLEAQMEVFAEITDNLKASSRTNVVVTDVSSVKGHEAHQAVQLFAAAGATFVPGHPMAGTEYSGFNASSADMFHEATWVLCPEGAHPDNVGVLIQIILAMGARVSLLDIGTHDAIVGSISHLPYVVAASLTNVLLSVEAQSLALQLAAGSFRDGTRVARSEPWLSASMVNFNRDEVLRLLNIFKNEIDKMSAALTNSDNEAVLQIFEQAHTLRRQYETAKLGTGHQNVEWSAGVAIQKAMNVCKAGALIAELAVSGDVWSLRFEGAGLPQE